MPVTVHGNTTAELKSPGTCGEA